MNRPSSPPRESRSSEPQMYKRSLRNLIIDARFQLKYTSLMVLVAVFTSAILGAFLWRTSREVVAQSQRVAEESLKVSDIVKMSIRDDPIYAQSPELLTAFNGASQDSDKAVREQQASLVRQQETMLYTLVCTLAVMVMLIGLLGIYFTHKVAGPIYKMTRLLRQVGEGKLMFHGRLRKGDELQDFFEVFAAMVESLRRRQQTEIDELDAAMVLARQAGASPDAIAKIALVRDEMKRALDT